MKKILLSIISVFMVLGMLGGGYTAYFNDTETSNDNSFTAGILDLTVDCAGDTEFSAQDEPLPEIFEYMPVDKPMAPGDSGEVTLSLHLIQDSQNADLWMMVDDLVAVDGDDIESEEDGDDDITDDIDVLLWLDEDQSGDQNNGEDTLFTGTLDDLFDNGKLPVAYNVSFDETVYVGWYWELPTTVGNKLQGDYCTFDIIFGADQVTSYNLVVNADPEEGGTAAGTGTYEANTNADITAYAATGWSFDYWTGDVDNYLAASTTVYMDGPKSVTAHFVQNDYTVTADVSPAEGGSVNGEGTFNYGDSVTLTAAANTGYTFNGWTGDYTGSNTELSFSMPAEDVSVTANFSINTYTITVTQGANGTISPSTSTVNYGDDVTFTITADSNYEISDVEVDGSSVGAVSEYTFDDVAANHTITATFASSVSASGETLNVWYAFDSTQSGWLGSSDLAKLSSSDDSRYTSGRWNNNYDNGKYMLFYFNNVSNVSGSTAISNAELTFEWQKSNNVSEARIAVSKDQGINWTYVTLTLPSSNTDTTVTLNLGDYGIDTVGELNNLVIKFQARANNNNNNNTSIDLASVTYSY